LLQERAQEKDGALTFQGDEDARDIDKSRLHGDERGGDEALRVAAYNEFTQALADELGIDDPDEVDAAIRMAMMGTVDATAGLTKSGAELQKAPIATADVPIGPAYRGHGGSGIGSSLCVPALDVSRPGFLSLCDQCGVRSDTHAALMTTPSRREPKSRPARS
jgi:hypothetical protein